MGFAEGDAVTRYAMKQLTKRQRRVLRKWHRNNLSLSYYGMTAIEWNIAKKLARRGYLHDGCPLHEWAGWWGNELTPKGLAAL